MRCHAPRRCRDAHRRATPGCGRTFSKLSSVPLPKGGGGGPPPPQATTSINDAPQQSSVGKFIAKTKPRTGQPTTRRESEFDVWVLARFVEHVSGAPRLGSASTLQTSVPYSTPGGVSTRPSRLVGGACSFVRGRSAVCLSGVPAERSAWGACARVHPHAANHAVSLSALTACTRYGPGGGGSPKAHFPISLPCSQPAR